MRAILRVGFLLLSLNVTTYAGIEIVGFPPEDDCLKLSPRSVFFEDKLGKVISLAQKKEEPEVNDRISTVSPTEAAEYFKDFVIEKLGEEEATKLSPVLFSPTYFGHKFPLENAQETLKEIAQKDGYLFLQISNVLKWGFRGVTMEDAKGRWDVRMSLLSPREVFEAYIESEYGRSVGTRNFEEYAHQNPKHMEEIFSSKYFWGGLSEEEKKSKFLTAPFGKFHQNLVRSIYNAALRIRDNSKQGDNIVIFGNTPYFVGRALQSLISKDPNDSHYRNIIDFPFSGSPNRIRLWNIPNSGDIVTPERLAHLDERLKACGLSVDNPDLVKHGTHFVDVIASGSGISYVGERILRGYKKANQNIPDMDIYCLNRIRVNDPGDRRNSMIAEDSAGDDETVILSFPHKDNVRFKIPARIIYVDGHSDLDHLPSDEWRVFPNYNACFWRKEYDEVLKRKPSLTAETLIEYFDTNLRHIMAQDKRAE